MVAVIVEAVSKIAVLLDADTIPVVVHALEPVALERIKREERLTLGNALIVPVELFRPFTLEILEYLVVELYKMVAGKHVSG